MKFFDYVFYRVCKAYSTTKDSSPEGAAVGVVATVQAFNILTCIIIYDIINKHKSLNKFIALISIIFFLVFNYYRYIYKDRNNYKILKEEWTNEVYSYRNGVFVTIYIILSIGLFFGLAIYLGSQKTW
jgi:hypothetical protein